MPAKRRAVVPTPCTPGTLPRLAPRPPFTARSILTEFETPSRINGAGYSRPEDEPENHASTVQLFVTESIRIRAVTGNTTRTNQSSEIWKHGTLVEHLETNAKTKKSQWARKWQCNVCKNQLYQPSGTNHAHRHLATHGIVTNVIGKATSTPDDTTTTMSSATKAELKRSLAMWTAVDHVPFSQTESLHFQRFLSTLNKEVKQHVPSGDTVRAWTVELFEKKKQELAELLRSVDKIHISFDGWTAPNGRGVIGIVGFWPTAEGKFMRALLGIREVEGRHDGINIAAAVREILQEYGIEQDQIGHYILDNAGNNNTAVDSLEEDRESDEGTGNRLRCLGHIIHLVVKPLYVTETDSDDEGTLTALGKIQELIHLINHSAHNKAQWELSDPNSNSLKSANETRWGSTDMMIKSVLRDVNKFDTFVNSIATDPKNTEAIRSKCRALLPTREDYAELQYLDRLLDKFRALQKLCQGAFFILHQFLLTAREWRWPGYDRFACRCAAHYAHTPLPPPKTP